MSRAVFILLILICGVSVGFAQSESDLKRHFEGQQVTLKIDMPATKDGVNIYPEKSQSIDYNEYANRLKKHGTSVRRGDVIMITKIKVKDKHIEFQLGGGGYGTIGDETGDSVHVPTASKSRREKNLEDDLKKETDSEQRKRIKRELDELRRRREREDDRNRAIAAEAQEIKKARIEQKALQGGSRFNVHFVRMDSMVMTPTSVMDALRKYVDFEGSADDAASLRQTGGYIRQGVVHVGPRSTYLKEGLSTAEVLNALGEPVAVSERKQDGKVVSIYEFQRSHGRILIAEFVSDALVGSRIETRLASSVAISGSSSVKQP
jgi:hypothetical protein